MEIKNFNALAEALTNMLIMFAKEGRRYQTDIYLYVDDEANATLEEFVNVGGNSWLDDDHICLYSDKEHFEDHIDWICETSDFATVLELSQEQLDEETRTYHDYEDDDDLSYSDYEDFVRHTEDYNDKIREAYEACIDEMRPNYYYDALRILEDNEIEEAE